MQSYVPGSPARQSSSVAIVLLSCAGFAQAQPTFKVVDMLPNGMSAQAGAISADGSTVVGTCTLFSGQTRAYRWRAGTGAEDLGLLPGGGGAVANGVNADGSIVAGSCKANGTSAAFRWTSQTGMVDLGILPGHDAGQSFGISADGSTIVGVMGVSGIPTTATVWRPDPAAILSGEWMTGSASSASTDGAKVAGSGVVLDNGSPVQRAFLWSSSGTHDLGVLEGFVESYGYGISGDAQTVVGACTGEFASAPRAFRWTDAGGMEDLGTVTGNPYSTATGASDDGSVIVGYVDGGVIGKAMAWTPELGMVDLNQYLPAQGVDLQGWKLVMSTGVSADGTAIAGIGLLGKDSWQGWIVTGLQLASGCQPDCDANGELNIDDFVCFQTLYALGDPLADCDASGSLDIDDFICFQTIYAIGC